MISCKIWKIMYNSEEKDWNWFHVKSGKWTFLRWKNVGDRLGTLGAVGILFSIFFFFNFLKLRETRNKWIIWQKACRGHITLMSVILVLDLKSVTIDDRLQRLQPLQWMWSSLKQEMRNEFFDKKRVCAFWSSARRVKVGSMIEEK